jgi:signal transduction histidine kinase
MLIEFQGRQMQRKVGSRETVLVVDDDLNVCAALQRQLTRAGYLVHCVHDGASALAVAPFGGVDLVILDLLMPGMNGFETCRALRAIPGWEEIPVLILTGTKETELFAQAIDSGADDFLTKPVLTDELLLRVQSLIRVRGLLAELREGAATIQAQNDLIVQVREAKEKLEAFLLHDLKNPIATILLQAELRLELEPDSEPWALTLAHAEHLLKLVASWMDHIRGEAQGVQPDLVLVAIRPFLEGILARHELWLKVRNIRGLIDMEDDQLAHSMDPVLMGRVLGNLLDNSLRYSPDGGTLSLSAARTAKGFLRLEVMDQGPGVPPEQRERLFDLYARLEPQTPSRGDHQNRGLGLAFCKIAVASHGGRIWVDNHPGGGGRFTIELP